MSSQKQSFYKNKLLIKNINYSYYTSPILNKFEFFHAFLTKDISDLELNLFKNSFKKANKNCIAKQIHSNKIVFGSELYNLGEIKADGIISDEPNQNLWIYTADCMPILIADKSIRRVAAIHCGRAGLEKHIIKESIYILETLGSLRRDLIVAIGPSISELNYLLDRNSLNYFYQKINFKESEKNVHNKCKNGNLLSLDIKEHAFYQFLNEGILENHIEISDQCTYDLIDEFHSYRRTKTFLRQYSFISS